MNVHEAAASARGGDRGGTCSTVARIMRAGHDGAETGAQAAHTFLGPCGRSPWQARGTGGRTAWYRHPATAATVAAALVGDECEDHSDGPLDERAARGAVARARPSGDDEQPPNVEWDGHGSGGDAVGAGWETRLMNPGDAVAFAIEQGGRVRVIGPGEVADITFASMASVVIVFPWAEGGRGNTRDVRTWVKVEVDGVVQGAWVSRAFASARAFWGRRRQRLQRRRWGRARRRRSGTHPRGQRQSRPAARQDRRGGPRPLGQRWSQTHRGPAERSGGGRRRRGDDRVPGRRCPFSAAVDPGRRRHGSHRRFCAMDSRSREPPPGEGAGSADLMAVEAHDHCVGDGAVRNPHARG